MDLEQEMKAKAQEARAKVIEAEAELPKPMAEAFTNGNLGIMDYYRMKNVRAMFLSAWAWSICNAAPMFLPMSTANSASWTTTA